MAEEIYKQEYNIRNVATRCVTLYPTRAQVVRDLNDITLKVSDSRTIPLFGQVHPKDIIRFSNMRTELDCEKKLSQSATPVRS